jgi:hypothetical protein
VDAVRVSIERSGEPAELGDELRLGRSFPSVSRLVRKDQRAQLGASVGSL